MDLSDLYFLATYIVVTPDDFERTESLNGSKLSLIELLKREDIDLNLCWPASDYSYNEILGIFGKVLKTLNDEAIGYVVKIQNKNVSLVESNVATDPDSWYNLYPETERVILFTPSISEPTQFDVSNETLKRLDESDGISTFYALDVNSSNISPEWHRVQYHLKSDPQVKLLIRSICNG